MAPGRILGASRPSPIRTDPHRSAPVLVLVLVLVESVRVWMGGALEVRGPPVHGAGGWWLVGRLR